MPVSPDPTTGWYVVTGAAADGVTDDHDTIQGFLDAAYEAGGGVVLIPPGLYAVASYLSVRTGTTIWAYGATIRATGTIHGCLYNFLPSDVFSGYEGHSHITVLGGTWDANAADGTTGTVTGETDCVGFNHGADITIRDATMINTSSAHALEFNSVDGGRAINCRFLGFRDNTAGAVRGFSEAVQIDIARDGSSSIGAYDNTTSRHILIQGCYTGPSDRLGAFGRFVGSHTVAAGCYYDDIQILDNTVDGCGQEGIHTYGWRRAVISGNTILNPGMSGIKITGPDPSTCGYKLPTHSVAITGNVIDSPASESGIRAISYAGSEISLLSVTGNTVRNVAGGNGIQAERCMSPAISGNTILTTATTGILVQYSPGAAVTGNTITGAGSQGVNISGSVGGTMSGNAVNGAGANGLFVGLGADGTPATDVLIANNRVTGAGAAGIRLSTDATGCTVTGNQIRKGAAKTTNGLSMAGTATGCAVLGNDFSNGWTAAVAMSVSTAAPVTGSSGTTSVPGSNVY